MCLEGQRSAKDALQAAPYRRLGRPLVLAGAERSGSTMLRLMLGSHPRIAFHSEMDYAFELLGGPEGPPCRDCFQKRIAEHPFFVQEGLRLAPDLGPLEQIDHVMGQVRDRAGKALIGLTIHHWPARALRVWPDARFIHLLRDGRDVGRSMIQMGWAGNMYQAVQGWAEVERRWAELARTVPADRRADVRYENLVRRPGETLAELCEFIGVPYDPAMLTYPRRSTYSAPSAARAEQWRTRLSDEEVRQAESRIGGMLLERGYELSGLPPLKITPWRDRRYRADSWARRKLFELRRYGALPLIVRALAQRIGAGPLRRAQLHWWYTVEENPSSSASSAPNSGPSVRAMDNRGNSPSASATAG